MTTKELIADLRAAGDPRNQKIGPSRELYRRAADRIASLETALEKIAKPLDCFPGPDWTKIGLIKAIEHLQRVASAALSSSKQKDGE